MFVKINTKKYILEKVSLLINPWFFVHGMKRRKTYYHFSLQNIYTDFFQNKLNFHYCQHAIFTYLPEATFLIIVIYIF